MNTVRLCCFLLASLSSVLALSDSNNVSLLDYELKSLSAPERHTLSRYNGKPVLMVFFEPGCSWCFRQVRAINRLHQRCEGHFEALAVGVNGTRASLMKEINTLRPRFPAYQASPELLRSIGGIPATPFTLLGDTGGDFVGWMRGYVNDNDLHTHLKQVTALSCT
ncbi:MAG: redoxin domain-containing protein [Pseudomonadales bacterium]|nr:redoxin domain-containing protein [Pseudomonadales bacterium]MDP6472516.1 redoxin domain-containing protein [Pseudomonadales bacterium]MDP6828673.1 redoxin domain-containing protein [Pseudomonadales bacterium]MDP6973097.1 redoxin domain-containing protein [Pseudomonadales bacterium]